MARARTFTENLVSLGVSGAIPLALLLFTAGVSRAADEAPAPAPVPSAAPAADTAAPAADAAAPPGDAPPPVDPMVERGKYLADAGDCISCHTRPGGEPYAGGRAFHLPIGTIYSTNITPSETNGIGKWTEADLAKAMHEGVAADGHHLLPAFPYMSFTKVSDEDVKAIYAYLRTVTPVTYTAPANSFIFQRWTMAVWNALFFKPSRYVNDSAQSAEWNRGAYLVEGLGHCGECHSPRSFTMAPIASQAFAGGWILDEVPGGNIRKWSAVNLTPAKTGLGAWSADDIAKYLKTGFSVKHAGTWGPMTEVIVNSMRKLTDEDTHAMAVYLTSLPPREPAGATITGEQTKAGEPIYKDRCSKCHMDSGRGGLFNAPPLVGSAIAQSEDPASLINVILYGPDAPKEVSTGQWETMKGFGDALTNDADVAAVANYIRSSWGNSGKPVTAADVAKQR